MQTQMEQRTKYRIADANPNRANKVQIVDELQKTQTKQIIQAYKQKTSYRKCGRDIDKANSDADGVVHDPILVQHGGHRYRRSR